MKRKDLVQALKELLTDEYDAENWVDKTDAELVQGIIDAGLYYKSQIND